MGIITAYPDKTPASDGDKYLTVAEDGSTRLTTLDTMRDGVLAPESVTSDTLAQSAVTSEKLSLDKTVDANGWTVYDFGTWKEYAYTKYWSVGNLTAAAVRETSIPYPVGLASTSIAGSGASHVVSATTVGPNASEIYQATTNIAASTGSNMTCYIKNLHSATQAFGSVTTSVTIKQK